jgi:predicted nucleic acid-binding protein
MSDEVVVDASVAAKLFITEDGSDAARALAGSDARFIAPDLVLVELANVAVKRLRRGDISRDLAEHMIATARSLFRYLAPAAGLTSRAFELATGHGVSTYDAMYVALAEARGCDLVSSDLRLVARASAAGLPVAVRAP